MRIAVGVAGVAAALILSVSDADCQLFKFIPKSLIPSQSLHQYTSSDGDFTAWLPGNPQNVSVELRGLTLEKLWVENGDTIDQVLYGDVDPDDAKHPVQFLNGVIKGIVKARRGKVRARDDFLWGGRPSLSGIAASAIGTGHYRAVDVSFDGTIARKPASQAMRIYLVGSRIYIVWIAKPPGTALSPLDLEVLYRFELTGGSRD